MRIEDCLPSSDVNRLNDIDVILESNEGDYLSTESVNLVEPTVDGSIPINSIFRKSDSNVFDWWGRGVRAEIEKLYAESYLASYARKKLSAGLSEYLWPSKEGHTRIEFRSPVPGFPPRGELQVVCSNGTGTRRRKRKAGGEYCLAACDDGTVRWLPESECVNGSHVWTVRLFECRVGGDLYLRDELQRTKPNVYNNCVINTYIGGNVNGSGKQIIEGVRQSAANK